MAVRKVSVPKVPKSLIKQIEYHKNAIGKHRDALRDLIDDAGAVVDSCDEAKFELERAIDTLSQYV